MKWLLSRIGVIYVILFVFILLCVDIKTVVNRNQARLLNSLRPDFTQMNNFLEKKTSKQSVDWGLYKNYFERVLRYMPNDPIASGLLGYVYFYSGEETKAISMFKSSANYKQYFFWSYYNLGVIYYKKGMYAQSFDYLNKAIRANAQAVVGFMHDSVIYHQILVNYSSDLDLRKELANALGSAYVLMEESLDHLHQYKELLNLSVSAISVKELPYQDAHTFYAAKACLELNQVEQAVLLLQRSIDLEKNNPETYLYLSRIFKAAGQEAMSEELLRVSQGVRMKKDQRFPYDQKMELRYF